MTLETHGEVAVLRLDDGKANALTPTTLEALDAGRRSFLEGPSRALVLTGRGRFFSAGLDLRLASSFDRQAMTELMNRFGEVIGGLFACPRPVVAAINGHAIAGGCVLAMTADQRVLARAPLRIGTNETVLGVGLPPAVVEPLRCQLPPSTAFRALVAGQLFDPEQALQLGLVDELAAEDQVLDRAVAVAARLAAIPAPAYAQAKEALRRPARRAIEQAPDADREAWLDTWFSAEARAAVAEAVARLGQG